MGGAASFKGERSSSPQSLPVILSLLLPSLPSFPPFLPPSSFLSPPSFPSSFNSFLIPSLPPSFLPSLQTSLPFFVPSFLLFAVLEVEPMASAHKLSRLHFAFFLLVIGTVNKGSDPPIQSSSSHLLY